MIDFNYTAPELLLLRVQEVLDAPSEPHRIGGVVYVPEGGRKCEVEYGEDDEGYDGWYCITCGGWFDAVFRDGRLVKPKRCACCGAKVVEQ